MGANALVYCVYDFIFISCSCGERFPVLGCREMASRFPGINCSVQGQSESREVGIGVEGREGAEWGGGGRGAGMRAGASLAWWR